jgi:hypothetical protein
MVKSCMDKKLILPTASLLVVAITAEAILKQHEPEPHVEAPALVVPTPPEPMLPTGGTIRQIS